MNRPLKLNLYAIVYHTYMSLALLYMGGLSNHITSNYFAILLHEEGSRMIRLPTQLFPDYNIIF